MYKNVRYKDKHIEQKKKYMDKNKTISTEITRMLASLLLCCRYYLLNE